MENNTNKTTKNLGWKIFAGTIVVISLIYILKIVGTILLSFPIVEPDMTRIEGYFLFSVLCCIVGVKALIRLYKKDTNQTEDESSLPTEEKQ